MGLELIENLSAAELKSQRSELVAEAAKVDAAELADRYVQSRTDAKLRDEKMAEQGQAILAAEDRAIRAEDRAASLTQEVERLTARTEAQKAANDLLRTEVNDLKKQLAELQASVADEEAS